MGSTGIIHIIFLNSILIPPQPADPSIFTRNIIYNASSFWLNLDKIFFNERASTKSRLALEGEVSQEINNCTLFYYQKFMET